MNAMTSNNGRVVRKSLAEQIDRLDHILDGLAEAINDTVVGAVQEAVGQAVRQAVQAAVLEVLTNAEIQRLLHPTAAPTPPSTKLPFTGIANVMAGVGSAVGGWCARLKEHLAKARTAGTGVLARGGNVVKKSAATVTVWLGGASLRLLGLLSLLRAWRGSLTLAVGAGLAIGAACYYAGPLAATLVSGLTGFVGSLVALVCRGKRTPVPPAVGSS
jgi:hypothetical protein